MKVYYPVWACVLSLAWCLVLFIVLSLVLHSPLPLQIAGTVALLRVIPTIVTNPHIVVTPDNQLIYRALASKEVIIDLNRLTSCSYFLGMGRARGSVPVLVFRLQDAAGSTLFLPAHWWLHGRELYALIRGAITSNNIVIDDKTARKLGMITSLS